MRRGGRGEHTCRLEMELGEAVERRMREERMKEGRIEYGRQGLRSRPSGEEA